jgi:hypothetical protein
MAALESSNGFPKPRQLESLTSPNSPGQQYDDIVS